MTAPDLEPWTAVPHHQLAYAHERIAELEAENARLREALRPFARLRATDTVSSNPAAVLVLSNGKRMVMIEAAAFIAAAAALTQET